jgi:imidazoleglycerol phosphate dehydratase HisB
VLEDQNRKIAHFKPTLAMNTGISVHISATLFDNYTHCEAAGAAVAILQE